MRRHWSWQQTPLGAVKAIPRDGKPVSTYDDSDDAWHEVETEIRRLIEDRSKQQESWRRGFSTDRADVGAPASPGQRGGEAAALVRRCRLEEDRRSGARSKSAMIPVMRRRLNAVIRCAS